MRVKVDGHEVYELRHRLGLTGQQFAETLGVASGLPYRWEAQGIATMHGNHGALIACAIDRPKREAKVIGEKIRLALILQGQIPALGVFVEWAGK